MILKCYFMIQFNWYTKYEQSRCQSSIVMCFYITAANKRPDHRLPVVDVFFSDNYLKMLDQIKIIIPLLLPHENWDFGTRSMLIFFWLPLWNCRHQVCFISTLWTKQGLISTNVWLSHLKFTIFNVTQFLWIFKLWLKSGKTF